MNTTNQMSWPEENSHGRFLAEETARPRLQALRVEVASTQAKLERLRAALAIRQQKLNRLLAKDAMNGTDASARTSHE